MEKQDRVLWVYSTKISCLLQLAGFLEDRTTSNYWLSYSVLRMVTRRQTHSGSKKVAECLPETRDELGAPIRHHIPRKSVQTEYMMEHYLHHLLGGR